MTVSLSLNLGPYVDYTDSVSLKNLKRVYSLDAANDPQKIQTGDIEVTGAAYNLIYTNLINSVNLYSNSIYVKIVDTDCSNDEYYFKLETDNLKWCNDNACVMTFSMDEYAPKLDCIRTTTIADNTNGDFQQYPTSTTYPHPRFRYCDVLKPTWFFGIIVTFFNSIDLLILSLNAVIFSINIIVTSLGFGAIGYIGFTYDKFTGCDRGFPAPFIRTYIDNVCTLCGVTVDDTTDPIHFDIVDPINPPSENVYYNACLLTAYSKKGVKMVGTMDYIPNNQPSWTLADLMSKLKDFWNARWYLKNDTLYFHRKDLISGLIYGSTYGIDLSTAADDAQLIGNVCYSWNGEGKIKRLNLNYLLDPSDNIGNELLKRFNGEYLEPSTNPNYKAMREITMFDFGAPAFVLDGQDSLYDANIVNAIGAVLSGFNFGGCLKTQGDTLGLAKILVYNDGTDIEDARVLKTTWSSYTSCHEFEDDQGPFFPITSGDLDNHNYPMSFSPCQDAIIPNLWQYWEIEKASAAKKTNIAFEFKMTYCCTYNALDLYMRVKLPLGSGYVDGEISSLEFNHENREITIKGNLV